MKTKTEKEGWQKRVREEHKDRILTLLKEKKNLRFKDFLEQSGRTGIKSEKGLMEVLRRLIDEGLIEKTHIKVEIPKGEIKIGGGEISEPQIIKKQIETYGLTKEGEKYQTWWLIHELLELKDKQSSYMHTMSSKYYSFGLSVDIIRSRVIGNKIPNLNLPTIPDIEDFIMNEVFREIKGKKIKVEHDDHKFILSFEVDFGQLTDQILALQIFIDDINLGKDVFSDENLYLNEAPSKLWALDMFINYSLLIGDELFDKNLKTFLKKFNDSKKFYEVTEMDQKLFAIFMKCVEEGKNPLKNKILFKNLIVKIEKNKGTGYYNLFPNYVRAAKISKCYDPSFVHKLDDIEFEAYNESSKLAMILATNELKA